MINVNEIKSQTRELAEKYRLSLLLLFGSQVTGRTHPQSDLDFGFLSGSPMSLKEIAVMQFDFSRRLKLENIELVDLKNAPPFLLKQVAQKSVLLYEKEPFVFSRFKIYALKLFMEAKKLLALRLSSLNKFLQQKHG